MEGVEAGYVKSRCPKPVCTDGGMWRKAQKNQKWNRDQATPADQRSKGAADNADTEDDNQLYEIHSLSGAVTSGLSAIMCPRQQSGIYTW